MSQINEAAFLRLVRGESRGPVPTALRMSLAGAARLYRIGVSARNFGFDHGWKRVERASVPVISVGNITLGGTGKTPMVEYVARRGRSLGLRVAILSRGYGQSEGMNDEGRVLEENLPDVPHLQGRDRASLARIAVEELESQWLVLDDGFQHRRLARDLDIVLIDALDPFGLGRIFPRGLLREPISSLKRANIVVLSRGDMVSPEDRQAIRRRAEHAAGPRPWAVARHAPLSLIDAGGIAEELGSLEGKRVAAFCGIGNPEGFRRTLEHLNIAPIGVRIFPDHHPYTATDVSDLTAWAVGLGAELVLTTQKDLVKLRAATLGAIPLRAVRIGLEVMEGEPELLDALNRVTPASTA